MKSTVHAALSTLGLFAFITLRAAIVAAPIEFMGYSTMKADTFFVIKEVHTAAVSGWISVGQSFRGYTIEGFDSKAETLTVQGPAGRIEVPIQSSRVQRAEKQDTRVSAKTVTMAGALRNPIKIDANTISNLADAIAAAGGLAEGAKATDVQVTRREADGSLRTYSVDASTKPSRTQSATSFKLRPADVIFVPRDGAGKK